ncbi:MAG: TonB family protein [Janthinobacterium lividum]
MDTSFLMGWLAGTLLPLGAIWLLFRLVLRRERCFGYNRALLLLAPVVAGVLPLLPRPPVAEWLAPAAVPLAAGPVVAGPVVAGPAAGVPLAPAPGWQPGPALLTIYLLGVLVSLGCLAYRYGRLRRATRHLPREHRPGYVLAYTGGRLPTSSFGRTIFWDETAALTPAEATSVLAHELGHVRQGHSRDLLWLEVWRALLWFNPFAHLLLPALRLTHELLADWQAMLLVASPADALAPAAPYPSLLARLAVRRVAGPGYSSLVQSFAFSFTLTRIAMLQNEIPVRRWKQWLALPVLGGVFFGASQVASAQTKPTGGEADHTARTEVIKRKVAAAMQQDLLQNGKLEPGTTQQFDITQLQGRPEETQVIVRRVKAGQPGMSTMRVYRPGETVQAVPPTPDPPRAASLGKLVPSPAGIYTYVEQMPALPGGGGMSAIIQQIQQNLVYPSGPPQEGRVFVSFVVLADGSVGDTKVVKSLAPAYDEAVVAAIQQLPRFVPGKQNGRPVAVSFTVPVMFKGNP